MFITPNPVRVLLEYYQWEISVYMNNDKISQHSPNMDCMLSKTAECLIYSDFL